MDDGGYPHPTWDHPDSNLSRHTGNVLLVLGSEVRGDLHQHGWLLHSLQGVPLLQHLGGQARDGDPTPQPGSADRRFHIRSTKAQAVSPLGITAQVGFVPENKQGDVSQGLGSEHSFRSTQCWAQSDTREPCQLWLPVVL